MMSGSRNPCVSGRLYTAMPFASGSEKLGNPTAWEDAASYGRNAPGRAPREDCNLSGAYRLAA
jgi:hypothetical protein